MKKETKLLFWLTRFAPPILAFSIFIGAWESYVYFKDLSVILLPSPHSVVGEFISNFWQLLKFSKNTLFQALGGLFIGTFLSVIFAAVTYPSRRISSMLENYSALAKALPTVAIYPICTVFFGIGTKAIVAIVTIGIFPIMFLYVLRGFAGVSEHDSLMESLAAGRKHRFVDLVLPRSVSYLMAGLRASAPTAIIITIVAQYFGGEVTTLGAFIRRESSNLHTLQMWGAIFAACILGLLVFAFVSLIDRYFSKWRPTND